MNLHRDTCASGCAIELRGVTRRFGQGDAPAVHDVSLQVPHGCLTTLLGPSGCGKTTVLRLMAGLDQPSEGQILMDGTEVSTLGPAHRHVGMVFQNDALFPYLDVLGNIAFGLKTMGVSETRCRERAQAALATVGLAGMEARAWTELSGGQRQRVALARALVIKPRMLLLDEPLSNLDSRLRRDMREEIRGLQQRLNLTVVYVTHDQAEAMAVSGSTTARTRARATAPWHRLSTMP